MAKLIAELQFEGVYISGAALSADLGLPDIGLTTLTEVASRAEAITRSVELPTIVDIDTGFGEPANVARTVCTMEQAGLAGCHLEDQLFPKRCGHLDGKQLVSIDDMVRKVKAAVDAKTDENFLVIARTDARGVDGLEAAIERAQCYVDAGAEMIFPEALANEQEFAAFRAAVDVPLMANMTEFGKSALLSTEAADRFGLQSGHLPRDGLAAGDAGRRRGFSRFGCRGNSAGNRQRHANPAAALRVVGLRQIRGD